MKKTKVICSIGPASNSIDIMSNDNSMNRFVNVIKKISDQSNKPDTLTFGIVKSVDPLKIDIGNNIILTEEFLFLGQMCRPYKVKIPHTHEYNGTTENAGSDEMGWNNEQY